MVTFDRRWLPLNALRAFDAVGRHLSFTAAAQALNVSQSAVSRHVIGLEELLGLQLFERRPQSLTLTKAGSSLLPMVRGSFDRIEQALNDVVRDGGGPAHVAPAFCRPPSRRNSPCPYCKAFGANSPTSSSISPASASPGARVSRPMPPSSTIGCAQVWLCPTCYGCRA